MPNYIELFSVLLVGLFTTSSSMLGAAIGLYTSLSKKLIAGILAFAAGSLIGSLVIDLAYKGALELHHKGFKLNEAWLFIASGFGLGSIIYLSSSLYLEKRGAAIRRPTQFKEFAMAQKRDKTMEIIGLLIKCELLHHLSVEAIEDILPMIKEREVKPGEILFKAGDVSDALYIVASGKLEVIADSTIEDINSAKVIAILESGAAFGEMGLLSGGVRTATIGSVEGAQLLEIDSNNFKKLMASNHDIEKAALHLSHERSIQNLSVSGINPEAWAKIAMHNLEHISKSESHKMLLEASNSKGAGMAIVLGNILDTIPGCLVIGAGFHGFGNMSITLMLGMFLGGIPEAAVSAAMLTKAGYNKKFIFGVWSLVLIVGMLAAVAGKQFIGNSDTLLAVFFEAVAGGAVLALVSHTMIPEAIHEGGSKAVLPTVAGFLLALFFAMNEVYG